jgi:DNA polymerase-1
MKKLLLIDGNAIMHRAYHAYPVLTNPKGEYVSIVYGFFTMLFLVLAEQKPDYLAVCFDRPKPTFRQTMYAGYHAHREELPGDFVPQIGLLHELLETMGVQIFELDGYEADDLIGTISVKAVQKTEDRKDQPSVNSVSSEIRPPSSVISPPEVEVIILSGDRDLLQLVNSHVKVLMPITGITKTALFGEAEAVTVC